ncbi:hypothetical protein [Nocardiopsis potens]|uniref:hypothetical protein n=1 Tax=Nocardiopsis potens TaxID=1246458 RepID=UPI00034A8780|nr:hypothetical protein [Nocardiopsis potens]
MGDFMPPAGAAAPPGIFASPEREIVQSAEQSHEYKKSSGSSDGAHTYDTIKR